MKSFFSVFFILFTIISSAQLSDYGDKHRFYERMTTYLGGTKSHSIYLLYNSITYSGDHKYIKISTSTAEPKFYKSEKVKADGKKLSLEKSFMHNDIIYELYSVDKGALVSTKKYLYLLKRNTNDFSIEGEPVKIEGEFGVEISYSLGLYKDDGGFFLTSSNHTLNIPFVKRFNYSLKEIWSKDISIYYPKKSDKDIVTSVNHDEESQKLIFVLDIAKCEDCGFFKRKKKVKSAIVGISVFDNKGENFAFVPEIPEGIVYSGNKYFPNEDGNISALFEIHKMGEDSYDNVNGSGYLYCKWDGETGELISSKKHRYTYDDVVSEKGKNYLSKVGVTEKFVGSDPYPRIKYRAIRKKLSNGHYAIYYSGIAGVKNDNNTIKGINSAVESCKLVVGISPEGELKWTNFHYGANVGFYSYDITNKDLLIGITTGNSVNYPQGSFKFKEDKKSNDVYVYHCLDLKTGEMISRKSFDESKANRELTSNITNYNKKAGKFIIGKQSNSGARDSRKARLAVLNIEK